MVDAVAHIDVKPPRLTKQGFVLRAAAPVPVAGGLGLAIRLRFHNHAPEQLAIGLALHQQAANQLGRDQLGRAAEEAAGESWEVMGGRGGYGSGYGERLKYVKIRIKSLRKMAFFL